MMKRKINEILSDRCGLRKSIRPQSVLTGILLLLIVFCSSSAYSQTRQVSGLVTDVKGAPVIGATVVVTGSTSEGALTGRDGKFSLRVSRDAKTLTVSYMGMATKEVEIPASNQVTVELEEDNLIINEVVVVGYGQQKKESIVGAITNTSGAVLKRSGGVSSVGAAITGNLPGVVTTASTGMPGEEDPRIIIRGRSSWNNSDPLVLVDGIERPMTSVDINSVESISVLKDASATAVFGVKGANGVILITTKRGSEGRADINIGVNTTMKVPSKLPNKYDSYKSLSIRNLAIERELGLRPDAWADITPEEILNKYRNPANLEERERYPNVDWADEMFKNFAMSYNAYVNIGGGTKNVKYFTSVDFLNEGDLYKKANNNRGYNIGYGFNRINVRSNLDFQLTKSTVLSANLSGSYGVKESPWSTTYEYNMWGSAYSTPPDVMMPKYSDGTWGYYAMNANAAANSIRTIATSGHMKRTTARLNTDFTLSQDLGMLVKGLSAKGTISWDNVFVEHRRGVNDENNASQAKWIDPKTGEVRYERSYDTDNRFDFEEGVKWRTEGGEVDNKVTERKLYYQLQLNYGATFGKHEVSLMGTFSRDEYAKGSQMPNFREDWVFRTTYNFNKKYFVEYNGAYNGSEKFSKENRFAFFSSGGAGWMLSEEKFMKKVKFIDMFKIRGTYGTIGDDNIWGRWLYMDQWAYGETALMGLETGQRSPYVWYRETAVGFSDVHWEKVKKANIGADFSFLKGLVAGTFDVFYDKRTDILVAGGSRAVPSYYGATPPVMNLGKVRTRGYELEMRFNYVFRNGIRLWANANITHAKDKILSADDPELLPEYQKNKGKHIGQAKSWVHKGYYNTWDEVYGSTIHGENDSQKLPGNYNIIDFNGDGVIDQYDEIPFGYPERPQNTYNATIGFEWKGFSAFLQFYGVSNVSRQVVFNSFPGNRLNTVYNQGSYWSKDNVNGDVALPRWVSTPMGDTYAYQHWYDGSYIRLKNAEIAYTWDSGWVKKIGISKLRVYVNGNNLWVWTKMPDDREANFAGTGWASQGAYPTVKRINLGIQITL